ncbi:MAG: RNA methyltransferase [Sphingomonadales bacterium]|nr:RNA methyltransferase [Sphingomonadales bacterium]
MAGPVIILVRPQLGENIGKAARAMMNFALTEMRLVAPRDGWPNPAAGPAASGADAVLDGARVFETTEQAVADLNHVYAATVRDRAMAKPVVTPAHAAGEMRQAAAEGGRSGILFGPERSGLANEDVLLADTVLTVPVNPAFGSLNLAQAVIIVAYEWFKAGDETPGKRLLDEDGPYAGPAKKEDLIALMAYLEAELDARGFFHPPERRDRMVAGLRNLLQSASLSEQAVKTLWGVFKALAKDS